MERRMAKVCDRIRIMIVPLILIGAISEVLAEEHPVLPLGARVRVTFIEPEARNQHEPKRLAGKLIVLTETEIALEISADESPTVLPRRNVESLELNLQQGRCKEGAFAGLVVGAGTGLVYGALFAANESANPEETDFGASREAAVNYAILLAPIGSLIGFLVAPGDKWQEVLHSSIQLGDYDCRRGQSGLADVAKVIQTTNAEASSLEVGSP